MPSLHTFYGHWDFWERDPSKSHYGAQKVTFDASTRLIYVNEGETELDVQTDLYSAWKEWFASRTNSANPPAISAIGGEEIDESRSVGRTYFLENGWRIQPWFGDYNLIVDGNLYTREPGGKPVNQVDGVSVSLTRSNITEVAIAGGVATENRLYEIWRILGLDAAAAQVITDSSITVGNITLSISQTDEDTTTVERSE